MDAEPVTDGALLDKWRRVENRIIERTGRADIFDRGTTASKNTRGGAEEAFPMLRVGIYDAQKDSGRGLSPTDLGLPNLRGSSRAVYRPWL
jgi:hypothetical protein